MGGARDRPRGAVPVQFVKPLEFGRKGLDRYTKGIPQVMGWGGHKEPF